MTKTSLIVLAAISAAACGGEKTPPPAPPAAPSAAAAPAAPAAAASPNGQAVFARTCQTCHQATGLGMPNAFPPLAGSPVVNGDGNRMIRLVLHGLQGPITVNGNRFNNVMPPWKSLSDEELAAVVSYVRSNFGNHAAAVTAADVARERAATASRTTMWTAPELGI